MRFFFAFTYNSGDPVDQQPRFPGCESIEGNIQAKSNCANGKLIEFIYGQVKYPDEAVAQNVEGKSIVAFTVETDGSLSNIHVLKDLGHGIGEESERVVHMMNDKGIRWIPGIKDGKAVKTINLAAAKAQNYNLNVADLSTGFYLLRIENGQEVLTQKLSVL